jgi:hypothetical protein
MKTLTLNYEQLKHGRKVIDNNVAFLPSIQGFLVNIGNSFKEGKITHEQKNELLKDLPKEIIKPSDLFY